MNKVIVLEGSVCNACGEEYPNSDGAKNCCDTSVKYQCGVCGDSHDTLSEARYCCDAVNHIDVFKCSVCGDWSTNRDFIEGHCND